MSSLGFIGTGAIAAPMIRHLVGKGHSVTATRRSEAVSSELARSHGIKIEDPQSVIDTSDIVFLCLRPHQVEAIRPLTFRDDQMVVSVMAATPLAFLRDLCAPVSEIVQTIPFEFLDKGGCPLPAFGNTDLLAELFEPENTVIPVSGEAALNAHFAACTTLPAVLDLMNTGAEWLAGETSDNESAERYVAQLVTGFLAAIEHRPVGLATARDGLATEGTLSLQMTEAMKSGGAYIAMQDALDAINERLKTP